METVNLVLAIIASISTIISGILSWKNLKEIQSFKQSYSGNKMTNKGNNNTQQIGSQNYNQVTNHDKQL